MGCVGILRVHAEEEVKSRVCIPPHLAGVLIALILPVYPPRRNEAERAGKLTPAFRQSPNSDYARAAQLSALRAVSVNERLLRVYQPYTAFLVVPIFALANAGVMITGQTVSDALRSPITWGVILGLVLGKLVGITAATAAFSRLRPGSLQPGLTLSQVSGGAALAGIGFTISLLIVDLALESPDAANDARIGVLVAAVLATGWGWVLFRLADRRHPPEGVTGHVLLRPVDPDRDHLRGPVDSPLTLVEYGDFECPFYSKATGSIREVHAHFGEELRYVFRHLPLDEAHPHARFAAEASEPRRRKAGSGICMIISSSTAMPSPKTKSTYTPSSWGSTWSGSPKICGWGDTGIGWRTTTSTPRRAMCTGPRRST